MIEITNTEVFGWEAAIRGMRNPMNSWDKSDSHCCEEDCPHVMSDTKPGKECDDGACGFCVGTNDFDLMMRLAQGGPVHAKYRRMIIVTADIAAPLYWWKEFDTYKVGTVANSCSTMHKIHSKPIELSDFSIDDFKYAPLGIRDINFKTVFKSIVSECEFHRKRFIETKDKRHWRALIQLLPSSYNQKRTVQLNYEVLVGIYKWRQDHKLDEWHTFCDWIKSLPYSEVITGE
jgi:diadenosine tetraphosphatase ApaH/serine/threonine PP2A family protein phosphatase